MGSKSFLRGKEIQSNPLKIGSDKNDSVCDVKYITAYTKLYHKMLDGRKSLKKLRKVLISVMVPQEGKKTGSLC